MKLDPGSIILVGHLSELIEEASRGEFGDFTNDKYAAPKIELYNKLLKLSENVKQGIYD